MADQTLKGMISLLNRSITEKMVDYTDENFHKDVFNHCSLKIVPHVPANSCPPLPALVYAIRNIMKPTFLLGHTLELLTLVGHVNIVRKIALAKATTELKWNDHYRNHPDPDVSTLSRAQEERLRRVTLRADEQQEMYRSIINTCFEVDIHWSLWHGSSETFWLKMQTYFPGQFSDQSDDPDALAAEVERLSQMHTYNYDLSEEERHDTRGTGLRCAKFAYDAAKYMEDPAAYCAQVGVPVHTTIDTLFPCPDTSAVVRTADVYLDRVLELVAIQERLFGKSD